MTVAARMRLWVLCVAAALLARPVVAQTDYYNTDAGRPVLIEDAYALERRGLEFQVAPVRLSRARGGVYTWGLEPELAFGFANRTQIEVGLPIAWIDRGRASGAAGVSGVAVSVLHNLNVETSIPAFAIAADVLLPVGRFGPPRAYPSLKGIMTRTFSAARVHLNAQYTFGTGVTQSSSAPIGAAAQSIEVSRWIAGAAVDRTLALRSLLMTAELYARKPLDRTEGVEWNSGVGVRYQFSPRWAMDGGAGRSLNGPEQAWYLTAGGAYAFGLPWRAK
jgi:Putative MetA-pathway of phenol degradation